MTTGLNHKGYAGSVEVSVDDGCLHGKLLYVNDLITYEGNSVPELRAAFEDAVDRYLEHCKRIGKRPDKPCSGTFNVRLGAVRHRDAAIAAAQAGMTLNEFVAHAIDMALASPRQQASAHARRLVLDDPVQIEPGVATGSSEQLAWRTARVRH